MARRANTYEFGTQRRTRTSKYPWDQWADGSIWRLEPGTDFDVKIESMKNAVYNKARSLEMTVRQEVGPDGNLYIQFYES